MGLASGPNRGPSPGAVQSDHLGCCVRLLLYKGPFLETQKRNPPRVTLGICHVRVVGPRASCKHSPQRGFQQSSCPHMTSSHSGHYCLSLLLNSPQHLCSQISSQDPRCHPGTLIHGWCGVGWFSHFGEPLEASLKPSTCPPFHSQVYTQEKGIRYVQSITTELTWDKKGNTLNAHQQADG